MKFKFIEKFDPIKDSFFRREGEDEIDIDADIIRIIRNCCAVYSLHFLDPCIDLFITSERFQLVVDYLTKVKKQNPDDRLGKVLTFIRDKEGREGYFVFFGD